MGYREAIYRDYVANVLQQTNVTDVAEWDGYVRAFRRNFTPFMPSDRSASIVDAGCGMGQFLYFLEQTGYTDYRGVDVSPECVEFCRRNGWPVVRADVHNYLSQHPGEFDMVVLNDVIEHFSKDEAYELLVGACESLKPGGVVTVKTGNMGCPLFGCRMRYCDFTHEIGFTEESLHALVRCTGFDDVEVHGYDVYTSPYGPVNVLARALWKCYSAVFQLIYLFYGHRARTITERVIVAVGKKPA